MQRLDSIILQFTDFVWGTPLLILLIGGGSFFMLYSRFIPFRYLKHGLDILMGKYDKDNAPGQISHFQALSSALASTVGMGNISGVAIAIHTGGPGALFWMWVCAFVGMATKFFTCSLAIMYRGVDDRGEIQGGPMYVITQALPEVFHPLAYMFSIAGLLGCISLFQVNQLAQIISQEVFVPLSILQEFPLYGNLLIGFTIAAIISLVIFGGIRRIGQVAAKLIPSMVLIYMFCGFFILIQYFGQLDNIFLLIIQDAFSGDAVLGGSLGALIIIGVRRAAFSNEAGIGTEAMAHGAARTDEPIREGMVAMLGPMIDTLIVCSITGFSILATGVWKDTDLNGISMTAAAFDTGIPIMGKPILIFVVLIFSITTIIGYSYYGSKCAAFLFGSRSKKFYRLFYTVSLIPAAAFSIDMVINLIDGLFALMAIPTMVSSIILAPKVMQASKKYFNKI